MKRSEYFHEKKGVLIVCVSGGLIFTLLLFSFGLGKDEILLLWICYVCIIAVSLFFDDRKQQNRMKHLRSVFDSLDQKYLLAEIADKPESVLEQNYFGFMKAALKAMTDEVAYARRLNTEYKDYIEQWIHEIKGPITGIRLICENNKTDITRNIAVQTELIERDVERVLFHARLGSVEKDYLIKEIALRSCVMDVLARNKQFLIQSGVCVHAQAIPDTVYSDEKWINFIINQIIINSIKYKSSRNPVITIESKNRGSGVRLVMKDNGIGIRPSETGRVFDKGFVGSNGRSGNNATGIGLYLCKQLSLKLGIEIDIESELNQYTTVSLYFPKNDHFRV